MRATLVEGGEGQALAHGGVWRSWSWLAETATAVDRALGDEAHAIGLVARNRPAHVAAFACALMSGRTTAMIYSAQSATGLAEDIRRLRLPAIVADRQDWSEPVLQAAREVGSAAVQVSHDAAGAAVDVLAPARPGGLCDPTPRVALEILSSGTTGAPKRIPLSWAAVSSAVESARSTYAGTAATSAPQVMVHPLGNVAGLAYVTPPLAYGQRLVLLEKFEPWAWAEAVRDYRPARGALPPAGVRMVLDADIPTEWLSSLSLLAVGGGKLDVDLHEAFEARFGIPILTAFGATEFGGVVANWSLDAYRQWGTAKRGSAGRASVGVALRIVDAASLAPLPAEDIGLLEAKVDRIGPDWIRTNDLGWLDADGFLFLSGRADGAINRGGFKVVPEMVANVLKSHEAIADAAVVGVPDARLGEVPAAAAELRKGRSLDPEVLRAWLRDRLVAYQVPQQIRIVEALPRNASMKISLPQVRALFA